MAKLEIDKEKVARIAKDTLYSVADKGAHPAELILAFANCIGLIIVHVGEKGASPIVQKELLDLAVTYIAKSIEQNSKTIQTH